MSNKKGSVYNTTSKGKHPQHNMAEQVPQSTIEDWLNKHSIHRSYISAISDILANPEHPQFNDRLKYLISAARILRESEGKLYMSYHIARMIAYILQAQEGTDKEAFNRLAKNLFDNVKRIMTTKFSNQNRGLQHILQMVRQKVPTRTVLIETVENLLNDIMTVNTHITAEENN